MSGYAWDLYHEKETTLALYILILRTQKLDSRETYNRNKHDWQKGKIYTVKWPLMIFWYTYISVPSPIVTQQQMETDAENHSQTIGSESRSCLWLYDLFLGTFPPTGLLHPSLRGEELLSLLQLDIPRLAGYIWEICTFQKRKGGSELGKREGWEGLEREEGRKGNCNCARKIIN